MPYDFKKEEEVKEFLENLGIEYRFECFHEKKPDGCHRLGDYMEAIKKDFEKAGQVYKRNCDENKHPKSCFKYGNYRWLGKGCKVNETEAYKYYRTGCDAGSPEGCFAAALMLTSRDRKKPSVIPKDNRLGLQLLDRACQLGSADGCYFASAHYINGNDAVVKDMKKAFVYTTRGCELGNMYACSNLSLMYRKGEGTEKNEKLAEEYKQKVIEYRDSLQKLQPTLEMEQGVKD
ncbi:cytochrome c oxidase assembly factor 7 homolog [Ornithodoros turicata]|uniref:cytochrome c oxidase assembly factor 7 homolog n=1 Tax=Ornithodoros turicata TaxID=34597 RepID=UPI003138D63B